ncbi:DinB family protein [Roseateles sp. L2-2]|uniref:DinB family protein n=1 Tax=Roseateles sp. L2-2 TaxID=3422597 RepID=UPI003D367514
MTNTTHASLLVSLFDYKVWANAEMGKALRKVNDGAADGQWLGAIRTMNHMLVVDRIFAAHLTGEAHGYAAANTTDTPALEALLAAVKETDAWYVRYVAGLQPEQLSEAIHFTFTDGQAGRMTREEMLLHVITHATYHRGAIGRMLVEAGGGSPPDTLTRFLHIAEPERRVLPSA